MFSKNAYVYPHGSPSSHPHRSSGDFFLHHHHHDAFSGHLAAAALYNQDVGGVDPSAAPRAGKKDRHSKINTAQGPRDRRVRLSIGVARKFFDLQETLGFDKPSKTLDWLLTKSKSAINDLEQLRAKGGAGDGDSECEVDSKQKSTAVENSKMKGAAATQVSSLAKESRMKARARARERTREKMKLNETTRNINGGGNDLTPIQFINNQLEFRKVSASSSSNLGFREAMLHYEPTNEDLIQESIVIKRKVKHHPSILGFQQNLIISSSNYGVQTPYNAAAAENWDNIYAILDQHKFINSTSNN